MTERSQARPRKPPLLDFAIARACTRWLGGYDCGKAAVVHVIWDEEYENGFACEEHLAELGTRWTFWAVHDVGPDCAMPGALFFPIENLCRCNGDLELAAEAVAMTDAHRLAEGAAAVIWGDFDLERESDRRDGRSVRCEQA